MEDWQPVNENKSQWEKKYTVLPVMYGKFKYMSERGLNLLALRTVLPGRMTLGYRL